MILNFQVTGANKGIGYGIVKGLCQKFDGIIYLTTRDEKRGQEALKSIKDVSMNVIHNILHFYKYSIFMVPTYVDLGNFQQ